MIETRNGKFYVGYVGATHESPLRAETAHLHCNERSAVHVSCLEVTD